MKLASSYHYQLQQDEDRAHHLTVVQLAHLVQLVTQQELEHEQQSNYKKTPKSSKECVPEFSIQVLPNEHDDTEVGIEAVTNKERGEDNEPRQTSWEEVTLHLEDQEYREDSETDQPDPDLKHRNTQPPEQLLLSEQHFKKISHISLVTTVQFYTSRAAHCYTLVQPLVPNWPSCLTIPRSG